LFWLVQSTYTGVYSRGGPTNFDPKDLSGITNRKPADARGVQRPHSARGTPTPTPRRHTSDTSTIRARRQSLAGGGLSGMISPSVSSAGGLINTLSMPDSARRTPPNSARRMSITSQQLSERMPATSPGPTQIVGWESLGENLPPHRARL
jgi:hypothetical protein